MGSDHARRMGALAFRDRAVRMIEAHAVRQSGQLSIYGHLLASIVQTLPLTDDVMQAALDRRDEREATDG